LSTVIEHTLAKVVISNAKQPYNTVVNRSYIPRGQAPPGVNVNNRYTSRLAFNMSACSACVCVPIEERNAFGETLNVHSS